MWRKIIDSPRAYYVLAAVLAVGAVASQFELSVPSRPMGTIEEDLPALRDRGDLNVVFVLVDTLRADRLSAYGYERDTSPILKSIASQGVLFSNVEAQSSWTKCSMASLWTGLYPPRSGITEVEDLIPAAATLPAERLKAAGFATAGLYRNGWVASNFGFQQGFDIYMRPQSDRTPDKMKLARRNPGVRRLMGTDEDVTFSAAEFIQTHAHEQFFLYLHYMDVHQYVYDQVASEAGFGTTYSDSYDASIHWVDRNIGRVLLELEEQGVFENTLVVIGADHGEGFSEHGEGHARTLYREVTEVPLIFVLPFRLKEGVVVDTVVRNIDIWPTIFDLLGMEPNPEADGRSLAPLIMSAAKGETPELDESQRSAIAYLDQTWGHSKKGPRPLVSVREDGKRLLVRAWDIEADKAAAKNGDVEVESNVLEPVDPSTWTHFELYEHEGDPWEQTNLADRDPETVARMEKLVEAHLKATPPWGDTPTVEIDDLYREQLRALGYVVE